MLAIENGAVPVDTVEVICLENEFVPVKVLLAACAASPPTVVVNGPDEVIPVPVTVYL